MLQGICFLLPEAVKAESTEVLKGIVRKLFPRPS